jgi:hypothetical protein
MNLRADSSGWRLMSSWVRIAHICLTDNKKRKATRAGSAPNTYNDNLQLSERSFLSEENKAAIRPFDNLIFRIRDFIRARVPFENDGGKRLFT